MLELAANGFVDAGFAAPKEKAGAGVDEAAGVAAPKVKPEEAGLSPSLASFFGAPKEKAGADVLLVSVLLLPNENG